MRCYRRSKQGAGEKYGQAYHVPHAVLSPVLFGQEPGFWGTFCLTTDPDGIKKTKTVCLA